jgi:hypothetical protein
MHIRREKARQSLAFLPVSKPHTHITYMLRQCTSIVYICYELEFNQQVYNLVDFIFLILRFICLELNSVDCCNLRIIIKYVQL